MSDIREAEKTEGVIIQTHIGGQALIEGIMMRGRYNWAVAVRQPDGDIYTEEHDLASGKDKNRWMYWPIVRGCTALVESFALGYRALDISANHAFDLGEAVKDDEGGVSDETVGKRSAEDSDAAQRSDDEGGMPKGLMSASMVIGLILGIALFIVAPAVLTNLICGDYGERTLLWNTVDGIFRIGVFIGYIWAISLMKDIRRMFAYHGAEHQTIHCYEHGLPLTPAHAAGFPRLHVRCGTAFLIMTMLIAIIVFTIVPLNALIAALGITNGALKLVMVVLSRIVLLPLVAGLSYEVTVKWAGSHPENLLVKVVLWPGLQMQRLTTNVPDEGMLECAIAAMQMVLDREEREAIVAQEAAVCPVTDHPDKPSAAFDSASFSS